MNEMEKFWNNVKTEEMAMLATSAKNHVTMRTVSPVHYNDAILIFTSPDSQKYQQLKENPQCCISVAGAFMEAKAEFKGHTMLDENAELRNAYAAKFTDAFDENVEHGGRQAEFILLKPMRIKGWGIENGIPTGPFEYNF